MDVTATAGLVNLQYQPDRLADQCTSGLRLIEKHHRVARVGCCKLPGRLWREAVDHNQIGTGPDYGGSG